MKRMLLVASLVAACHTQPPAPMPTAQLVGRASGPFTVQGHVIALFPPAANGELQAVIVAADGTPYKLWLVRYTGTGMTLVAGNQVTAWCHDSVADSVRVDS